MSSVCAFFSYANADRKLADQFRGEFEKKHVICETGKSGRPIKVCLPIQLRGCECMLISSYRESILSYLS